MTILLDYNKEELYKMFENFNMPKFRIDQLVNAIYSGKDYGDNINLPRDFLEKIQNLDYIMQPIKIRKALESKGKDKTIKFLYDLNDGKKLYVNTGLGFSLFKVRFFSCKEIVKIELRGVDDGNC